jgi:hypothetical protein
MQAKNELARAMVSREFTDAIDAEPGEDTAEDDNYAG